MIIEYSRSRYRNEYFDRKDKKSVKLTVKPI